MPVMLLLVINVGYCIVKIEKEDLLSYLEIVIAIT